MKASTIIIKPAVCDCIMAIAKRRILNLHVVNNGFYGHDDKLYLEVSIIYDECIDIDKVYNEAIELYKQK